MVDVQTLVHFVFYISAIACAAVLIRVGSVMTRNTRRCLKNCLRMVAFGLVLLVLLVFYEIRGWPRLVAMLPIIWGITGWLLFDQRYKANSDLIKLIARLREVFDRRNRSW